MLSSRQLREGNYLQKDGHWLQIEVEHIEHIRDGNKHNFQPIVLTPEILEKNCGFVFTDDYGDKTYRHVCLVMNEEFEPYFETSDPYYSGCYGKRLLHLHQLQNLYYAINQIELTINNL